MKISQNIPEEAVIGDYYKNMNSPGVSSRPGIFDGIRPMDLNDLIPSNSGWVLDYAFDINNNGEILCHGKNLALHLDGLVLLRPIARFSRITITSPIDPTGPPLIDVQFLSSMALNYLVKWKATLVDPVWKWLQIIPGNGGLITASQKVSGNSRFFTVQALTENMFLFPIRGLNPCTAKISAVFDHSQPDGCADGKVVAFTGETGEASFGHSLWSTTVNSEPCLDHILYGFPGALLPGDRMDFMVNGNYEPSSDGPKFLYYDGHTGYDFPYDHTYEVVAAAAGIVHKLNDDCNQIWIDHGNGYETWYVHMRPDDTKDLVEDTRVSQGERIGFCGDYYKKVGGVPNHLHFTVKKTKQPVDPYGWGGKPGKDPLKVDGHDNIILWKAT